MVEINCYYCQECDNIVNTEHTIDCDNIQCYNIISCDDCIINKLNRFCDSIFICDECIISNKKLNIDKNKLKDNNIKINKFKQIIKANKLNKIDQLFIKYKNNIDELIEKIKILEKIKKI